MSGFISREAMIEQIIYCTAGGDNWDKHRKNIINNLNNFITMHHTPKVDIVRTEDGDVLFNCDKIISETVTKKE